MGEDGKRDQLNHGRTIGDVLFYVLAEPRRWLSFVALMAALLLLLLLAATILKYSFHIEPQEIQLFGNDPHVLLKTKDAETGDVTSLVLVHPQGWQQTDISLTGDEEISFVAGGKVNIDLHEITDKIDQRIALEAKYKSLKHIRENDASEKNVPEQFYDDNEIASIRLNRPWIGPEGFSLDRFQPGFRSRREKYLLPGKPAGGLVAAVYAVDNEDPPASEAFYVGRSRKCGAPHSGYLWLTINDVIFDRYKELFYNDNIGFYWVKLTVKRKGGSSLSPFSSRQSLNPSPGCS